ncbi:MAG: LamG-like jellyroll fold domain-containing protein, partial [Methanosarcinales archaeon]
MKLKYDQIQVFIFILILGILFTNISYVYKVSATPNYKNWAFISNGKARVITDYYIANTTSFGTWNFYHLNGSAIIEEVFNFRGYYDNGTAQFSTTKPSLIENGNVSYVTLIQNMTHVNMTLNYTFNRNSPVIKVSVENTYTSEDYTLNESFLITNYSISSAKNKAYIIDYDDRLKSMDLNRSYFIEQWTHQAIYGDLFSIYNIRNFTSLQYKSYYKIPEVETQKNKSNIKMLLHFNDSWQDSINGDNYTSKNNNITFTPNGKFKSGVNLTGTVDLRYSASDNINIEEGTITFWFKPIVNTSEMKHKYYFLEFSKWPMSSGGRMIIYCSYSGGSSCTLTFEIVDVNSKSHYLARKTSFYNNTWYYMVFGWKLKESGKLKGYIYINKELMYDIWENETQAILNSTNMLKSYFEIGGYAKAESRSCQGIMDEFTIYDKMLKESEFYTKEKSELYLTLDDYKSHIFTNNAGDQSKNLRKFKEKNYYSFYLAVNHSINPKRIKKERLPYWYASAYVFTSHADYNNHSTLSAVYYGSNDVSSSNYSTKGLVKHNIKTTQSIFEERTGYPSYDNYNNNATFKSIIDDIYKNYGYEIIFHGISTWYSRNS